MEQRKAWTCSAQILKCHERTFQVARKAEALGVLLERSFEGGEDASIHGLGRILMDLGKELTTVYQDLDQIALRLTSLDP